jgi:hypothetical protein
VTGERARGSLRPKRRFPTRSRFLKRPWDDTPYPAGALGSGGRGYGRQRGGVFWPRPATARTGHHLPPARANRPVAAKGVWCRAHRRTS